MERKAEELKGRAKEAAGDLTGDEDLQRQGREDQVAATAKRRVDQAKDKAEEAVQSAKGGVEKLKGKASEVVEEEGKKQEKR